MTATPAYDLLASAERGTGPATVLLHPLGGDRDFWASHVDALPGRVIRMDLPGHGESSLPAVSTLEHITGQFLATLDALEVQRCTLVGVSLGGLVAQHAAARVPERLLGMVLVDTVAGYPEPWPTLWVERAAAARRGLDSLLEASVAMWFSDKLIETGGTEVDYLRGALLHGSAEGYARMCEALARASQPGPMPTAHVVPTLVMCGEDDIPLFVQAATELTVRWGAGPVRWLPGRHAAALESAARATQHIADFVTGKPAPTGPA